MSKLDIKPVTEQDIEDAAYLFLMSINAYIGFDKSGLEVAGAAHTILNVALQNLNKQHEQTTGVSEIEGGQRASLGSGQVQKSGETGGLKESSEGIRADVAREEERRAKEKPRDEDQNGANLAPARR